MLICEKTPNRAFSGRGCAAREPWPWTAKVISPAGLLDGHAAPLTPVVSLFSPGLARGLARGVNSRT